MTETLFLRKTSLWRLLCGVTVLSIIITWYLWLNFNNGLIRVLLYANFTPATHLSSQEYSICIRRESGKCAICYTPAITINIVANGISSFGLRSETKFCRWERRCWIVLFSFFSSSKPRMFSSCVLSSLNTMTAGGSEIETRCLTDYILVRRHGNILRMYNSGVAPATLPEQTSSRWIEISQQSKATDCLLILRWSVSVGI